MAISYAAAKGRSGAVLIGEKELDRKLKRLGRQGSRRAVRAGINAGLSHVARALRAAIDATPIDTTDEKGIKRAAKKTVGKRFGKAKGGPRRGQVEAKVGLGVGKRGGKRTERLSSGKTRGVGISAINIHWFVLGTDDRYHKSTGHPTGRIEPLFKGVAARAAAASKGPALTAARKKIQQVIEREARKKG